MLDSSQCGLCMKRAISQCLRETQVVWFLFRLFVVSLTRRNSVDSNSLSKSRSYKLPNRAVQIGEDSCAFGTFLETDCFERQQVEVATIRVIYFPKERQHWASRQLQKSGLKLLLERGRKFLRIRQHYVFRNHDINIRDSLSSCHLSTSQLGVISRPRRVK